MSVLETTLVFFKLNPPLKFNLKLLQGDYCKGFSLVMYKFIILGVLFKRNPEIAIQFHNNMDELKSLFSFITITTPN